MKKALIIVLPWILIILVSCFQEDHGLAKLPRLLTLPVNLDSISNESIFIEAEFIDRGESVIEEYGFTWSLQRGASIQNGYKASFIGNPPSNGFSITLDKGILAFRDHFIRAYVVLEDQTTVYGTEVEFTSKGRLNFTLERVEPKEVNFGDTVTLFGSNFGNLGSTFIEVENYPIDRNDMLVTESEIKFTIPTESSFSPTNHRLTILLASFGDTLTLEDSIRLIPPTITSYQTTGASYGEELTFWGENLESRALVTPPSAKINGIAAEILETTTNSFTVVIPLSPPPHSITFTNSIGQESKPFEFEIDDNISIDSVALYLNFFNGAIRVYGEKWGEILETQEDYELNLLVNGLPSHWEFRRPGTVPAPHIVGYFQSPVRLISTRNASLEVEWGGSRYSAGELSIVGFIPHIALPEELVYHIEAVSFNLNGKGFTGSGKINGISTKTMWEYDPDLNEWSNPTQFPGSARHAALGMSLGDKILYGGGINNSGNQLRDFWLFDGTTWTAVWSLPSTILGKIIGASVNNQGFALSADESGNFYQFQESTGFWTAVPDFEYPNGQPDNHPPLAAFSNGGLFWVITHKSSSEKYLTSYNPQTQTWSAHKTINLLGNPNSYWDPKSSSETSILWLDNTLWVFDTIAQEFDFYGRLSDAPSGAFFLNGKLNAIGPLNNGSSGFLYESDLDFGN